jgi:ABC-type Na+ transport system ATPase subunit NatA
MTRMWMVDPRMMCRQHLLGEHAELHMIAANIKLGRSIEGYIRINALEPRSVERRHGELVDEMGRRGIKHKSPLEFSTGRYKDVLIDRDMSLQLLIGRCPRCADRMRSIAKDGAIM